MADFVASIDQGTTSTRAMIFNHRGEEVGRHQLEHQQLLPRAGWVEHNPVEIWERTWSVLATSLNVTGGSDQPARDHVGVEPSYRPAVLQCHRVAGHPHRQDRGGAGP
ncbi:Glycerol kinase (GlpK) [Mycobacteroides abscessus subsp. massiliense]|nr:Glycerol kinase (GlpK) [Mycobacteroides abscessus subsp. massiliense]